MSVGVWLLTEGALHAISLKAVLLADLAQNKEKYKNNKKGEQKT
jgi:hypothetical protein